MAVRLRELDNRVLGPARPPAPRVFRQPSEKAARLREDWRAWSIAERLRFAAACALLLLGAAAQAWFLVPWAVVAVGTASTVFISRRCRDALRELCYLAALLNVLAGFYALLLLPLSLLLGLAGLIAPSGVRRPTSG
jgi:hypothetical protein